MDVNVKVTVDLGDRAMSLFGGIISANEAFAKTSNAVSEALEKYQAANPALPEAAKEQEVKPDTPKAESAKRVRRAKPEAPAAESPKEEPAKEPASPEKTREAVPVIEGWDDMDDDDRLEAIKSEVTKHAKAGRSTDIRAMLSHFGASRASELAPENYEGFITAIRRYGNGETLETILQDYERQV